MDYCGSRAAAACRDLRVVDSEAVEPKNLSVVGHISDLLHVFTLLSVSHDYIGGQQGVKVLRSDCQATAVRVLNFRGQTVRFSAEYPGK